jgi:hypothetical protein
MSTDMLDRLQESKIRAVQELIDNWSLNIAGDDGNELAATIADLLVDETIGLRQGLARFWDYYWTAALSGKVCDRQQVATKIRLFLDRGSVCLSQGATLARRFADLSGHPVARLAQLEEQSAAFPLWVEECMARWEMLDRPRKPLDRDQIARARTAFERGECEPASDILARLEKGGSLVRE